VIGKRLKRVSWDTIGLSDGVLIPTRAVVDGVGEISSAAIHSRIRNTKVKTFFGDDLGGNLSSPMPIPLLIGVTSQSLHACSLGGISSPELNVFNAMNAFDGRGGRLRFPSEEDG
jgi:hypothetical protein